MFVDSASLILFFKTMNLVSVIILAVIGFKRYLTDYLTQQKLQQNQELGELNKQKTNLDLRQHEIDNQGAQQEKQAENFLTKLQQWQQVEKEKTRHFLEKKELQKKIFEKKEIERQERIILRRYIHKIVPQVVASCEEQLKKEFSEKKNGHDFLHNIIDFMKETS